MFDFTDRIVLVTGAAGNLGAAVARAFHQAGGRLALVDRRTGRLAQVLPEIAGAAGTLLLEEVDMTDEASVQAMASRALEGLGHVDVLVHTVGGYRAGEPLHATPVQTWDFMLDINARSYFLASRALIPAMLQRGQGKIVAVAARAATRGGANMAAYSAAKAAVVRLTESMAAELRREGINVNCVLPGTIDTPQNRQAMPAADHARWVAPEAIAEVILFLASDSARAVHGAAVPVYGES